MCYHFPPFLLTESYLALSILIIVYAAIGDYQYKFNVAYVDKLFRYMPTTMQSDLQEIITGSVTPPYISGKPSVRYMDLQPIWDDDLTITLFTDGVDNLVHGEWVFHQQPEEPSTADPCQIVATLLKGGSDTNKLVGEVLGHNVEPRWNGTDGNRAVEILGNLLGGTDVHRLEMCMDQKMLTSRNKKHTPQMYIDDTTIIVCNLREVAT